MASLQAKTDNSTPVHITPAGDTINIRHGEAAPIREPQPLRYAGRLDSPQRWLEAKKDLYGPADATVLINGTEGTISLVLDEKNELSDAITGALAPAPELAQFRINADHKYSVPELVTLLKRLRFFFPNKEEHARILNALQNFSAQVSTKYEQVQNNNGSSKNNLEREVHGITWEREFVLSVPVYKGYKAESFRVEIGVDPTSAGVKLFLDSPELYELQADLKSKLLEAEAEYFTAWGCSVIYVS